jgi:hypothetical protein
MGPGAPVVEFDTFTCAHDNRVVIVKHGASPEECGGFCRLCMKAICPECVGKTCVPFEKRLDLVEKKGISFRSIEQALR